MQNVNLKLNDIACAYNTSILFHHLSLTLKPGSILFIEGPNGSGKTSLLRIIAGLTKPFAGEITWCDHSIYPHNDKFQKQMLFIGHKLGIKENLTTYENLMLFSQLNYPATHKKIEEAIEWAELREMNDILVSELSAGQRRKLALAKLIIQTPPLWLLDEPLATLDAKSIERIEHLIINHINKKGIVVLTSHQPINFHETSIIRMQL